MGVQIDKQTLKRKKPRDNRSVIKQTQVRSRIYRKYHQNQIEPQTRQVARAKNWWMDGWMDGSSLPAIPIPSRAVEACQHKMLLESLKMHHHQFFWCIFNVSGASHWTQQHQEYRHRHRSIDSAIGGLPHLYIALRSAWRSTLTAKCDIKIDLVAANGDELIFLVGSIMAQLVRREKERARGRSMGQGRTENRISWTWSLLCRHTPGLPHTCYRFWPQINKQTIPVR